nr:uncharacterized protein LOC113810167 [Penaeus vannamei]
MLHIEAEDSTKQSEALFRSHEALFRSHETPVRTPKPSLRSPKPSKKAPDARKVNKPASPRIHPWEDLTRRPFLEGGGWAPLRNGQDASHAQNFMSAHHARPGPAVAPLAPIILPAPYTTDPAHRPHHPAHASPIIYYIQLPPSGEDLHGAALSPLVMQPFGESGIPIPGPYGEPLSEALNYLTKKLIMTFEVVLGGMLFFLGASAGAVLAKVLLEDVVEREVLSQAFGGYGVMELVMKSVDMYEQFT